MDNNVLAIIRVILALPLLGFWMWMLWDMSRNEDIPDQDRLWWFIAFFIANIFTAIYYYVRVYQRKT